MSDDSLAQLLARLDLNARGFPGVTDGKADVETVVVTCSMGHQGPQCSLWPIDTAGEVAPLETLGNQTWARRDGRRVLNESLAYLLEAHDVRAVAVVGHTDCSVVADAYDRTVAAGGTAVAGIEARLGPLVEVVEDAVAGGVVEHSNGPREARRRLVEYNVVEQVSFLADSLPPSVTVAGYVRDEEGVYGAFAGRHYLVALDGESDPRDVRASLPDDVAVRVARLLQ